MHLSVKNLGRISKASLDIRPFTVFIGPTNTNKTWTAYSLYGLTNNLSRSRGGRFLRRADRQVENDPLIESSINEIVDQLVGDFVGLEDATTETSVELHRNHVIPSINHKPTFALGPEGIATLLDTSVSSLQDARVELQLELHEFQHNAFDKVSIDGSVESGRITSMFYNNKGERIYGLGRRSFFGPKKPRNESDVIDVIKPILREAVQHLVYSCFGHVAVLPAERKALVWMLRTFGRFGYRGGILDGPIPLGDFLSMLIEAENVSDIEGASRGLPEIALLLEEKILKGSLSFKKGGARGETFDTNEEVTPKRERAILSYAIDGETYLQMHAAASLVRSLAGLDIYLKYFAHSGDILIIDEPEMNAHPDAQLMIMELLAILANSGITVVITTHSPYIVDHLNNLIAASTLPAVAQDTIASHCKLNRKDAFIGGDSVATYLFTEQGTVEDIFDRTQTIIDLSSFSDTSNYVTNLYAKILDSRQGFSCDEDKDSNDGA